MNPKERVAASVKSSIAFHAIHDMESSLRLNARRQENGLLEGGIYSRSSSHFPPNIMNCLNTQQQQLDFSLLSWEMSSGSINSWLAENCSPPMLGISNPMSLTSDLMDPYNPPLHSFPDPYCMQPMYPAMWLPPSFFPTQPMQLVRAEIRERSDNWTVEETKAMLAILIANKKKFDNIRRHPSLWSHLAAEMNSKGFVRSVDKCKNRWKVLVAKYKKSFNYLRDNLSHEPHHHPENFEFFDQMSSLLHAKLTKGPASLIRKFKISP